jgi:hypothetical protein
MEMLRDRLNFYVSVGKVICGILDSKQVIKLRAMFSLCLLQQLATGSVFDSTGE